MKFIIVHSGDTKIAVNISDISTVRDNVIFLTSKNDQVVICNESFDSIYELICGVTS